MTVYGDAMVVPLYLEPSHKDDSLENETIGR